MYLLKTTKTPSLPLHFKQLFKMEPVHFILTDKVCDLVERCVRVAEDGSSYREDLGFGVKDDLARA